MYNINKNTCRKETYKFRKSGYLKKKSNSIYYQNNKYNNSYNQRYSHSTTFSYNSYDYEYDNYIFYEKNSVKSTKNKNKFLKEVTESNYICEDENKDNSTSYDNSTTNDYQFQEVDRKK